MSVVKKTPALIVVGFKDSGKTTLCSNIVKDFSKKYAIIIDDQKLPQSIVDEAKSQNLKIEGNSTIFLPNGTVITLLFEDFVRKHIVKATFDQIVFISDSFDSSFLYELLSCIEEGALAQLADKISLANVVGVVDSQNFLEDLKSTQKLKDRFKFTIVENKSCEDDDCKDDNCSTTATKQEKDSCCNNGKCEKEVKKEDDCCKDGHCEKKEVKKEDDCCKDGHCTSKESKKKESKCDDGCCDDHEDSDLISKAERKISTLLISQIQSSHVFLLNKTDLVSSEESDFIEKLLGLITPNKVIKTTNSVVDIKDLTKIYHQVRDHKVVNETCKGVSIANFYHRRPFHPERLFNFLYQVNKDEKLETNVKNFHGNNVIYINGDVWLANDMIQSYVLDILENTAVFEPSRVFFSKMDKSEWNPFIKEHIEKEINSFTYQDRKVELSIIAHESLNINEFIENLTKCLLTDSEMALGPNEWETYDSPFDDYAEEEDDEDEDDEDDEDDEEEEQ